MFAALGTTVETVPAVDVSSPRITALMSVYNGERFLCEAIGSILNQSFGDFEFIIIDDGSTDGTEGILASYNDPRIQLINNQTNIGLTKSLNRGLSCARGEYIARMDADDISMPQRFACQVEFLDENPQVILAGSNCVKIDSIGRKVSEIVIPEQSGDIVTQLFLANPFAHGSMMFRRGAILNMGGYDESVPYGQDYNLLVRFAQIGQLGVVPSFLHKVRIAAQGISKLRHKEQLEGVIRYSSEFFKLCHHEYSEDQLSAFARFQRARLNKDWSFVRPGDIAKIKPVFSFISRTSFGRKYWRRHLFSWAVHLIKYSRIDSLELFFTLLKGFRGLSEPKQILRYVYYYIKSSLINLTIIKRV